MKQNRLKSGADSNEKDDNPNQRVDKKQRARVNLRSKSRSELAGTERQKVREKNLKVRSASLKKFIFGISLVAQWLRIQLPMQGTRV